ncbi:MAG: HEAT repeat domain-containing protein [Pirellulaceae bacterium]
MSNTEYDIPKEVKRYLKGRGSTPAFRDYYRNFFVSTYGLSRREVDLSFLKNLKPHEAELAKDLIRRNLACGYSHIIEGAAALHDREALPILREMLSREVNLSRRLTIAGSLWKLDKDSSFPDCLREMADSASDTLKEAHFYQIAWLGDKRAIALLFELLEDKGRFVKYLALSRLNEIELKKRFIGDPLPHTADYYLSLKDDDDFLQTMVDNLNGWYNVNAA